MTGMPEEQPPSDGPTSVRCPWCSAALPSGLQVLCPSCQATLVSTDEAQVPGVTAVDVEHLVFGRGGSPKRNRLLAWISGESDEQPDPVVATPSAFVPPPAEVRREMLRLELDAELADRTAEVEAIRADAALGAEAVPGAQSPRAAEAIPNVEAGDTATLPPASDPS